MHGGARTNAGRKAGSTAAKTVARLKGVAEVMKAVNETLPKAFQGDAHAFLIATYKNPANPMRDRLAAAQAAIGYEKPKLSAVEMKAEVDATLAVSRIELVAPSVGKDDHAAH